MGSNNNHHQYKYRLGYLHHTALNELYVFTDLPVIVWKNIFNSCFQFIKKCQRNPSNEKNTYLKKLFNEKTEQRLKQYCDNKKINIDDCWLYQNSSTSLKDILLLSEKYLPRKNLPSCIIHGDFCFSNILYDFRTHRIKIIDPRGIDNDHNITIYGDSRYDIAKLCHSVLGMYDWIVAGYYNVKIENREIYFEIENNNYEIQSLFIEMIKDEFDLSIENLYAMQIQLFLSMLPLHTDDIERQNALFSNAFRLYHDLLGHIK
jgi:hypothetical protein